MYNYRIRDDYTYDDSVINLLTTAPWAYLNDSINSVVFSGNIESIGSDINNDKYSLMVEEDRYAKDANPLLLMVTGNKDIEELSSNALTHTIEPDLYYDLILIRGANAKLQAVYLFEK